jgi:geranylgeranyl reductase
MDRKYDAVIIGAGPSGLKCAESLGNSHLEILILEKKDIIGPKICAGGLTSLTNSFNLPEGEYREFQKQSIILNNNEHEFELKNPLKTISRLDLGKYQLSELDKFENVRIETGKSVKKINKNHVTLSNGEEIGFNYLIGCDGTNSIVRKCLNLPSKFYVGYQYILPEEHDKFIWFLEPEKIKSGYGWIFPHKDFTSAGVYFNPDIINSKMAKDSLNEFLDNQGVDYSKGKFQGSPVNVKYVGNKFGNVYLAGEASGLVSANTGEGISYALINGEDIAMNILENREMKETKRILKFKQRQETCLKTFDMVGNSKIQSLMFEVFVKLIKNKNFQEFYGN